MANKKDYSEIKKRRDYLPGFMVNWNRLPEYLAETNQEVQSLQVLNTAVGRFKRYSTELLSGNSFIAGKKYRVNLEPGDDFTNIGYIENGTYFIATGTTPTIWLNGSAVFAITEDIQIFYNDIDTNFEINPINASTVYINISNSLFNEFKTFPIIQGAGEVNIINLNKISTTINEGEDVNVAFTYFKIEVYI